jgi:GH15 family glucan-1,4-alpha-glucosidase
VYTLRALLALGCEDEARAFFWWQMHATRMSEPELRPLYRVDGSLRLDEQELPLPGYMNSTPVRDGNAAATQLQLDAYGPLLEGAWRFWSTTRSLGAARPKELAALADFVAAEWQQPDSGIWESRDELRHYVLSKAMCWTALDRAAKLADEGVLPERPTWRAAAERIRAWVETEGWDEERHTYVCMPGDDMLDASVLTMALCAYAGAADTRMLETAEAIRRELAAGPFLYRFSGAKELEGAFLTCSFWLVDLLARAGRHAEASDLMEELVAAANDVGLYADEIDPDSGAFLGNLPQGLVHLALVNAAVSIAGTAEDQ